MQTRSSHQPRWPCGQTQARFRLASSRVKTALSGESFEADAVKKNGPRSAASAEDRKGQRLVRQWMSLVQPEIIGSQSFVRDAPYSFRNSTMNPPSGRTYALGKSRVRASTQARFFAEAGEFVAAVGAAVPDAAAHRAGKGVFRGHEEELASGARSRGPISLSPGRGSRRCSRTQPQTRASKSRRDTATCQVGGGQARANWGCGGGRA